MKIFIGFVVILAITSATYVKMQVEIHNLPEGLIELELPDSDVSKL